MRATRHRFVDLHVVLVVKDHRPKTLGRDARPEANHCLIEDCLFDPALPRFAQAPVSDSDEGFAALDVSVAENVVGLGRHFLDALQPLADLNSGEWMTLTPANGSSANTNPARCLTRHETLMSVPLSARSTCKWTHRQIPREKILKTSSPDCSVDLGHIRLKDDPVRRRRYEGQSRRERDDRVHRNVRHDELPALRVNDAPSVDGGKVARIIGDTLAQLHAIELTGRYFSSRAREQVTVLLEAFLLGQR